MQIDDIETSLFFGCSCISSCTLESGTESGTNYLLTEDGDWIVSESYSVSTIDTSSDY